MPRIIEPRMYLVWSYPGEDALGRIELVPPKTIDEPEQFHGRTVGQVTIPKGCVIRLVRREDLRTP